MNTVIIIIINIKKMKDRFITANDAFHYYNWLIKDSGIDFDNTKALFNVGFHIERPMINIISDSEYVIRNWKEEYAEAEWQWYLSGDRNVKKLEEIYGKIPEIWKHMTDENGNVNSNYGWQWIRGRQLDIIIEKLRDNSNTRQAAISIYDGKEIVDYENDTPCTYAVQFTILDNKLNMCVVMRSNDLWYGFCNDQYCFSNLLALVAHETGKEIGEYYHFAHNLHLYNDKINE